MRNGGSVKLKSEKDRYIQSKITRELVERAERK